MAKTFTSANYHQRFSSLTLHPSWVMGVTPLGKGRRQKIAQGKEMNDYQGLWQERWGYLLGARQVRTVIREKTAGEREQIRTLSKNIRNLEEKIFEGKADAKAVKELVSLRKARRTVLTQANEKVRGERKQLGYILQALRAIDQRAFEALKADGVEVKPIIPSPPATAPSEGSGA